MSEEAFEREPEPDDPTVDVEDAEPADLYDEGGVVTAGIEVPPP